MYRCLLLKDIVVECTADDVERPALNGLGLTVVAPGGYKALQLEKTSKAKWKYDNVVKMFPSPDKLSILARSETAGFMGQIVLTMNDWDKIRDNTSSGSYLKRDFNIKDLSLSLSVHVQILLTTNGNPTSLDASQLSREDADPLKFHHFNSLGLQFLQAFRATRKDEDICRAIDAYGQASACLPANDPRWGPMFRDVCICNLEYYEVHRRFENLQAAIMMGETAIARITEEDPTMPSLLSNLGVSYYHNFKRSGNLNSLSEGVKNLQRAVHLTPDDHSDLPGMLTNLGLALSSRFESLGDLDDISHAIEHQERAVDLAPNGHTLHTNLGLSLLRRFERNENPEDISEAIKHHQQAVHLTPDGHAQLPTLLINLGSSFYHRFRCSGNLDDISEAIKIQQRAVDLTPNGHPDLPGWLTNLGVSLSSRFIRIGDLDNLSEAIKIQRRAVDLTPDGHPHLASMLTNLGASFLSRFDRNGYFADISEAIETLQRAVHLTPDGHPDLPGRLTNLGISIRRRFGRLGELEDISEAIKHLQQAVYLTPDGHAQLPTLLINLGNSYSSRFTCSGNLDDISEAIKNHQRAVDLALDGHADLPIRLSNLGSSFRHRFERSGDLGDISEAIKIQERAVHLMADGHAQLPALLAKLGHSLYSRFERSGELNDLFEAIKNQQRAVHLIPDGHTQLPNLLTKLGHSLCSRSERSGDLEDISEAVKNHQRAVYLTPDGHADLPGQLDNLGLAFFRRFERLGDLEDITEAIKNQQHAVSIIPDGHVQAPALNNLGNSFFRRFERSANMEDLSQAIKNQKQAVDLTPDDHTQLPSVLTNLGNSLWSRFERTGDLNDISEAITNQKRAVDLTPEGHARLPALLTNLGVSFFIRFEHNGDLDDLCEAIKIQEMAVHLMPDGHALLPGSLTNLATSFLHRFQRSQEFKFFEEAVSNFRRSATSTSGPLFTRLWAAKEWATCARSLPSMELLNAHACIIQLLSLVSGLENTVQRRHQTLVEYSQLSLAASAAALSIDRPDKALEWLIEGRCIVWNQINQLRTPVDELRAHDPALVDRFSAVSKGLENAGSRTGGKMDDKNSLEEQAREHIKLVKERDRLLAAIRNTPGFEDFLQPKKCADIMRRLPDEGIIVIINIYDDRCDALALMAGADEPMHIPLSLFSYQEAERLAKGLHGYLRLHGLLSRIGIPLDDPTDPPLPYIDLVEILSVLWRLVVLPILESLAFSVSDTQPKSRAKLPRIWWCPTGPLAFLPIHAAGIHAPSDGLVRQCLSDFAVSSYIPTVNVLLKSTDSNPVQKYGDFPAGLLLVSQPNTPGKSQIPHAADETKGISSHLENEGIPFLPLDDERGTNTTSPLESSINLHDGPLQLSEIMKKNLLYSDFAFLSACQTSVGDRNLPEEVVHLAAGMLAAGYRSVVGTMWSIVDKHGADVADLFYKSLLENATKKALGIDGSGAARALHHATQQFREKISSDYLVWVPYIHIGI